MEVYLAGANSAEFNLILHAVGYPARLTSYFFLKDSETGRRWTLDCEAQAPGCRWIMDSGLFSFMFGSQQDAQSAPADFDGYRRYATEYVEAMHRWGWKHAVVECDVQRVLGVEQNERLRDEVFRKSGLDVVYVWHLPDGEAALVDLAKRERRIALSIPELRKVLAGGSVAGGDVVKKAVLHCLRLIASSGGNPRVHLLGNTEVGLSTLPVESGDSTSWKSSSRFGTGYYFDTAKQSLTMCSIYSAKWTAWRRWCERRWPESFRMLAEAFPGEKQEVYNGNSACCALAFLLFTERLVGRPLQLPIPDRLPTGHRLSEESR